MKSILLNVQPKWLEKILNGEKTIEIRKTNPKCELPIDVYLYCGKYEKYDEFLALEGMTNIDMFTCIEEFEYFKAKNRIDGKVVAKFTLKYCDKRSIKGLTHSLADFYNFLKKVGINWFSESELFYDYVGNKEYIYLWHITNLQIFDKPKELSEFKRWVSKTIYCGMDCPPYQDEVLMNITKAPKNYCYCEVEVNE